MRAASGASGIRRNARLADVNALLADLPKAPAATADPAQI